MAWFKRPTTAEEVLDRALGRILDAQASQIEAVGGLLAKMSELSTKRAAQALGSRGGRARVRNELARRSAASGGCPLCVNPMFRDVTVEIIAEHRKHGAPPAPVDKAPQGEA